MKLMIFLLLFSYVLIVNSAPSASGFPILHPGGIGGIFKGPDSETIVKGPDGSVITSLQEGGSVVVPETTRLEPIVVADSRVGDFESVIAAQPIVSNGIVGDGQVLGQVLGGIEAGPISTVSAAPIIAAHQPILTDTAISSALPVLSAAPLIAAEPISIAAHGPEPHRIDIELVDAPDVESDLSATLIGPSGTIETRGSKSIVSGPASTTISEPVRRLKLAPIATPILNVQDIQVAPQPIAIASEAPILSSVSLASLQPPLPVSTLSPPANIDVGAISTVSSASNLGLGGISVSSTLAPLSTNIDVGAISTFAPYSNGLQNSLGSISSTVAPLELISSSTASDLNLSNEASLGIQNVQADPISSYGFINNANNVDLLQGQVAYSSSTEIPIASSTIAPQEVRGLAIPNAQALGGNIQNYLDQAAVDNRQIVLNPSDISSSNILPPEIGVQGARYLGSSLSVSEAPLESSNIQRIAKVDNSINIDGRLGSFNANDLLTGEIQVSGNTILDSTSDIAYGNPIDSSGRRYRIQEGGPASYPIAPGIDISERRYRVQDGRPAAYPIASGIDTSGGRYRIQEGGPAAWNGYRTETRY